MMRRLLPLVFVCIIDVLGFGILIPLVPYMADQFGTPTKYIPWILGSYSASQLIAAPFWGHLSDRFGRRPILLTSSAGACVSYIILGFATGTVWLLVSRMLSGFMAGNISAALAYASDVSEPQDRAKALGMVGASIGIGFMLGPAIGGLLVGNDVHSANFALPATVSACLSVVAMGLVMFALPESHTAEHRAAHPAQGARESRWALLSRLPALRNIALALLLVTYAQSTLESMAAIWAFKKFQMGPRSLGLALFSLAFVAVIIQGGLVRLLVPKFGERRLAIAGALFYVAGLLGVAYASTLLLALLALIACGAGGGCFNPAASALASQQSDASNRGSVMGTYQASSSLARVIGPAVAGLVVSQFDLNAPFLLAALMALPACWLINRVPARV